MEFLILRKIQDDGTEIDSHVSTTNIDSFKEYGETSEGEITTEIQFTGGTSIVVIIEGDDLFKKLNEAEKREQDKINKRLDDRIDERIKIALDKFKAENSSV